MVTKTFKKRYGTRAEVLHGTAQETTGHLKKKDLFKNKHGRIVSKKKHLTEKKRKNLEKHGYFAVKGKFGYTKTKSKPVKKNKSMKNKTKKALKKNKSKK